MKLRTVDGYRGENSMKKRSEKREKARGLMGLWLINPE